MSQFIREGFSEQWVQDRLTLLDIAILSGGEGLAHLIDETTRQCPEFQIFPAKTLKGTSYKQLVRIELPKVGFRHANEGAVRGKGKHENRRYECHIFDPRWEADKAVADSHEDGREVVIAESAEGIMLASFQHMGSVFYYGTIHDPKSCAGLMEIFSTTMEVDATGTTDAEKSSVWGVHASRDQVQWLLGAGGKFAMSPVREQDVPDADGNPYLAYVQGLLAHIGVGIRDIRSVGRIKNLTSQTDKKLTEELFKELWFKFPNGAKPTAWLLNSTQHKHYWNSLKTEHDPHPPMPTEALGIPFVITDSIIDGHAAERQ